MSVRPLTPADLAPACRVVEHAFALDPALLHLLPDPKQRARIAPHIAKAFLRYGMSHGIVWCTDDVSGVALRRPPGSEHMSILGILTSGIAWLPFRLGLRATWRMLMADRDTGARHKKLMRGPHWYLWMIAVDPSRQGEGLGGQLMARPFVEADSLGVPCYLETSHPLAKAIHEAHGFVTQDEGPLPGTALMVWSMVREPVRRLTSEVA
jgi:GNAT superfamily N-acetyltransferase